MIFEYQKKIFMVKYSWSPKKSLAGNAVGGWSWWLERRRGRNDLYLSRAMNEVDSLRDRETPERERGRGRGRELL